MLFRFKICLNAIPESPLSRYVTEESLKDAIRKVDRTLLRVRGKKVAHIISVEEVDYGEIISELPTINYTYASDYNISTVNYFTAASATSYSTAAATTAYSSYYYIPSASTLTSYYSTNVTTT